MQWSPEQISGRLRLDEVVSVSAEWIYRHVWENKRNGGDLYKHLRRRGKKRNARGSKYSGRGHIPGRVDISERPGAAQELGTGFFFATPYHSWERGLNEHTNGLVRQYFPKATDFHEVLGEDVRRVEELFNGRPRKVLNYRTPAEVFNEASC